MIALQFKVMNYDPEKLFRIPCSVQPSGLRKYHVRRDSEDKREKAEMFLLTGNIELPALFGYTTDAQERDQVHQQQERHQAALAYATAWSAGFDGDDNLPLRRDRGDAHGAQQSRRQ